MKLTQEPNAENIEDEPSGHRQVLDKQERTLKTRMSKIKHALLETYKETRGLFHLRLRNRRSKM